MRLEDLQPNASVRGVHPVHLVTVVSVQWYGTEAVGLTYKTPIGKIQDQILYRSDEADLEIVEEGRPWSFDGDGALFRLVSEANRIQLAHLFDPLMAIHTSLVEPLPHQISAVYESMMPRQPLRFLLADDPGAGKTIMAGLFIKELIIRGDLQRCLIVCPGNLAEQWQDELYHRFNLPFEILTNEKLEAARTGNWFMETNLVIARLDKLSRNEDVQNKLMAPDCRWDLVVCDEAHKMSASYFGGEIKYTKRYHLGELLSTITRHFLLMTATPHNGKEADFQLFLALLDGDRFEGKFRDGVHTSDASDLMRRMVKENLVKFDGKPLFPKRIAYSVPYKLSTQEAHLYKLVTDYVREEFNRADALDNNKRKGTVGFALTILQRRLASSPEAIYKSLLRRRERLETRLRELELLQRGRVNLVNDGYMLSEDDLEDLEEAPDEEVEKIEEEVLDQATAAGTIFELKAEIETLKKLEAQALLVKHSGNDTKWQELSKLLDEIFHSKSGKEEISDGEEPYGAGSIAKPVSSPHQKIVIFTEHRDTLNYLENRISTLLGDSEAVVVIHGGLGREDRRNKQEAFQYDPKVKVLVATDAAGEGINLQRAHLMVNYDLPWNPNRIEQRFGRIHRIGQTEVCHLWNLVAEETREGDVYLRLLQKLEQARQALGGQVFDVLGNLEFGGQSLQDLLIKAIRFGDTPEMREYLNTVVDTSLDLKKFNTLLDDYSLAHDVMDTTRVQKIREDMERAEARRLQPHYIESFFMEAFQRLGGNLKQREARRYEIKSVPNVIRNRDRIIGIGEPVLPRYERITFEKDLISPQGQALAAFVCPGHPLLDATLDLILEKYRDLLRQGTMLVDERDTGTQPHMMFVIEHAVKDGRTTQLGEPRIISKRILNIDMNAEGKTTHVHYAPYLDFRPVKDGEPGIDEILNRPECSWILRSIEKDAQSYAITQVIPKHLQEVSDDRLKLIHKTEAAVKSRLTKEITHWYHRSEELKLQEQAGKTNAKLNSGEARKRAENLDGRLQKRMEELKLEAQIAALSPVVLGGFLVVPIGLIQAMQGTTVSDTTSTADTLAAAAAARSAVMKLECSLGFEPVDREFEKLGYDIESRIPGTGKLRFIEVKGRVSGASTLTVTRNEILYSLNKPDDYILAMVEFYPDGVNKVYYLTQPFRREPDFDVTSVNYNFSELLSRAKLMK